MTFSPSSPLSSAMRRRPSSFEETHMNRFAVALLVISLAAAAQAQELTPEKKEFFENHIRPVLAQQCFACHTNSMMAGLRLDSREGVLKGGKSGPAVVPGDAEKSLLITKIKSTDGDSRSRACCRTFRLPPVTTIWPEKLGPLT